MSSTFCQDAPLLIRSYARVALSEGAANLTEQYLDSVAPVALQDLQARHLR